MNEFLNWLFSRDKWPEITIDLFDFWHISYVLIIISLTVLVAFLLFKKDRKFKNKILDIFLERGRDFVLTFQPFSDILK